MKHLFAILIVLGIAIGGGLYVAYGPFATANPSPSCNASQTEAFEGQGAALRDQPLANATAAPEAKAPATPAPRPPADAVEARRLLAELSMEENRFKKETADRFAAAGVVLSSSRLSSALEYLWLISLNTERFERSLAVLLTPDAEESPENLPPDNTYPVDIHGYKSLLERFLRQIPKNQDSYQKTGDRDENAVWLAAWERKTIERQLSPFLEPFLSVQYGRWNFFENRGEQLAGVLWPLRADAQSIHDALAYYHSSRDAYLAVEKLEWLIKERADDFLQALREEQAE